jgi:hypothetical protein
VTSSTPLKEIIAEVSAGPQKALKTGPSSRILFYFLKILSILATNYTNLILVYLRPLKSDSIA